jgi:hypothetical protein
MTSRLSPSLPMMAVSLRMKNGSVIPGLRAEPAPSPSSSANGASSTMARAV